MVEVRVGRGGGEDFPEARGRGEEGAWVFAEGGEVAVCEEAGDEQSWDEEGPLFGEEGCCESEEGLGWFPERVWGGGHGWERGEIVSASDGFQ